MLEHVFTLLMLILLQAVLGFDNLLYISIESKRAPLDQQARVRKIGILLAIVFRIALLFLLVSVIDTFQNPILKLPFEGILVANFNIHSLIVLLGGAFIVYTAMKEIWHLIGSHNVDINAKAANKRSVTKVILMIVVMNIVFSFDSILSAMALTKVFWVMATAIVIGGLLMIWLADKVADFLEKNKMYEVLGLFILFIVGIMLISEGGHLANLAIFGNHVTPMSKTTFYFVIVVLVLVDVIQGKYQKRLLKQKQNYRKKEN